MEKRVFALVLDAYQSHTHPDVAAITKELGIELIFVLKGGTGEFQPLDRRTFRVVKLRNMIDQNISNLFFKKYFKKHFYFKLMIFVSARLNPPSQKCYLKANIFSNLAGIIIH